MTDIGSPIVVEQKNSTAGISVDGHTDANTVLHRQFGSRDERIRSGSERQDNLETYLFMQSGADVEVILSDFKTATVMLGENEPIVAIPTRRVEQHVTDYERVNFDRIIQYGYADHEGGHIKYTPHRYIHSQAKQLSAPKRGPTKQIINALEDGVVEELLRDDNSSVGVRLSVLHGNLAAKTMQKAKRNGVTRSFFDAVTGYILDLGRYDTHISRKLLDEDDAQVQFSSEEDKAAFCEFQPLIEQVVTDVLSNPSPQYRVDRMFEFADSVIGSAVEDTQNLGSDGEVDKRGMSSNIGEMPDDAPTETDSSTASNATNTASTNTTKENIRDRIRNLNENTDRGEPKNGDETSERTPDRENGGRKSEARDSNAENTSNTRSDSSGKSGRNMVNAEDSQADPDGDTDESEVDESAAKPVTDETVESGESEGAAKSDTDEETTESDTENDERATDTTTATRDRHAEENGTGADTAPTETERDGADDQHSTGRDGAAKETDEGGTSSPPSTEEDREGDEGRVSPDTNAPQQVGEDGNETDEAATDGLNGSLDEERREADEQGEAMADALDSLTESNNESGANSGPSKDAVQSSLNDEITLVPPGDGFDPRAWRRARKESEQLLFQFGNELEDDQSTTWQRGQSTGQIDPTRLVDLELGAKNAFRHPVRNDPREKQLRPADVPVVIMVDRSTSMKGDISCAERATTSLALAFERVGVNICVMDMYLNTPRVAKPFELPVSHSKDMLMTGETGGNTPLSEALSVAADQVRWKGKEPFVVVITDGEPNSPTEYEDTLTEIGKYAHVLGVEMALGERYPEPTYDANYHAGTAVTDIDDLVTDLDRMMTEQAV